MSVNFCFAGHNVVSSLFAKSTTLSKNPFLSDTCLLMCDSQFIPLFVLILLTHRDSARLLLCSKQR